MTPPKKPNPPSNQATGSAPAPNPGPALGAGPGPGAPPARVRVDDMAQRLRRDPLPLLYLLGFVILGGTLFYLYKNPTTPPEAQQAVVRVDSLQGQVQALTDRLAKLEVRPASAASDLAPLDRRIAALEGRPAVNLEPLQARVAAVEGRPAPPPVDLAPLEARVAAVEGRPAFDPAPLTGRIDAAAAKQAEATAALAGRVDSLAAKQAEGTAALAGRLDGLAAKQAEGATAVTAGLAALAAKEAADTKSTGDGLAGLDTRLGAVEAQSKQTASQIGAVADRAGRVTRMQAALSALNTGQPLGDIPGAPPPVARFATQAPPTEADLRRQFDAAADAAQQAGQPALMRDRTFGDRLWARAQQAVTVRQSDRVLVGDPVAGKLILARTALDAGDLAGAVRALDGLAGPAQAAMADWVGQARALLDARAALSGMAARG